VRTHVVLSGFARCMCVCVPIRVCVCVCVCYFASFAGFPCQRDVPHATCRAASKSFYFPGQKGIAALIRSIPPSAVLWFDFPLVPMPASPLMTPAWKMSRPHCVDSPLSSLMMLLRLIVLLNSSLALAGAGRIALFRRLCPRSCW